MNKLLMGSLVIFISFSMIGCSPKEKGSSSTDIYSSNLRNLKNNSEKETNSLLGYNNYSECNDETILLDSSGKEEFYEVLLTIDKQEAFGKNYMLIYPSDSVDEDIKLEAYSYVKNQQDTGGKLFPIETNVEWGVIEEVFNQFMDKTW